MRKLLSEGFFCKVSFIQAKICFIGHIIVHPNICRSFNISVFSSTGRRPASYCHGIVSVVHASVSPSVCASKVFLQKTSPQKLLTGFLPNSTGMFRRWSSFKFLQIIVSNEEFWLPWEPK